MEDQLFSGQALDTFSADENFLHDGGGSFYLVMDLFAAG
jgi:hypothetical protein